MRSNNREIMADVVYVIPNLKDYDISEKVGFLPENPRDTLPSYFAQWENLATKLEYYIERKEVRKMVDEMSFLENYESKFDREPDDKHKQRCLAYVFLTFIGSAYICEVKGIAKVILRQLIIPRQLAMPWHEISKTLGLKPVPCMASVAINNYQLKDKTMPISLENLEVICKVPGARWFFLVTIQVEVEAAKGIKAIVKAKQAVHDGNDDSLKLALQEMKESIQNIQKTSARMREHLDGDTFYNVVRPFLSGYGGEGSPIPDGLVFEGVSEEPVTAIGGSAAQSSTIQSFDEALGIKHKPKEQKYLDEVRGYMPPGHRRFIEVLSKEPSIKNYVTATQDTELKESYKSVVDALLEFRNFHFDIVKIFILKPSEIASAEKDEKEAGAALPNKVGEITGTGGTKLEVFLKEIIETTEKAKEYI